MKLKILDCVILNKNIPQLQERGIKKDCDGIVSKIFNENCRVCFFNPTNYGEYIFATVEQSDLTLLNSSLPEEVQKEMLSLMTKNDTGDDSDCFSTPFKEYDLVEVIVEKQQYVLEGVHKGMRGVIISTHAIQGKWLVLFDDEHGNYITDMGIHYKDICLVNKS